jgi:hypothetical protein
VRELRVKRCEGATLPPLLLCTGLLIGHGAPAIGSQLIADEGDHIQKMVEPALASAADMLDTPMPGIRIQGVLILYDNT